MLKNRESKNLSAWCFVWFLKFSSNLYRGPKKVNSNFGTGKKSKIKPLWQKPCCLICEYIYKTYLS